MKKKNNPWLWFTLFTYWFCGRQKSKLSTNSGRSVQVPHVDYDVETKLNLKQEVAFIIIMEMINSRTRDAFFIDRLGGTSKTFLYWVLLA